MLVPQDLTLVALFSSLLKRVERWWGNTSFKFINYAPFNPTDVSCFPGDTQALGVKQLDLEPVRFLFRHLNFFLLLLQTPQPSVHWKGNVQFSDEFSDIRISSFFKDFLDREKIEWTGLKDFILQR